MMWEITKQIARENRQKGLIFFVIAFALEGFLIYQMSEYTNSQSFGYLEGIYLIPMTIIMIAGIIIETIRLARFWRDQRFCLLPVKTERLMMANFGYSIIFLVVSAILSYLGCSIFGQIFSQQVYLPTIQTAAIVSAFYLEVVITFLGVTQALGMLADLVVKRFIPVAQKFSTFILVVLLLGVVSGGSNSETIDLSAHIQNGVISVTIANTLFGTVVRDVITLTICLGILYYLLKNVVEERRGIHE
ncbi:hypothetical protein [Candidatus Enterococcus willemsii]|nr:hypothetical protein [Enterococcus sp. CU12B]